MITLDFLDKMIGIIPIDKNDILKILEIEDNLTVEIYGNYEKFAVDQISDDALLYKIFNYVDGFNQYKKEKEAAGEKLEFPESTWLMVGKIGYLRFTIRRIKYFWKNFWKRSDLNFFTRVKMSLLKTKRFIGRTTYIKDISTFTICPEFSNHEIKRLFNEKKFDRLYIYKTRDENILNQLNREELNNRKLRQHVLP